MAAATATLPALLQSQVSGPMSAMLVGAESRDSAKRYKKYELIGQGAQKKVYRAFDEERGIEVAWNEVTVSELARFREKDQQRVFSEILVLKQLKHKNIMTLFDYWLDAPRFTLVFITEIFPDGTLRQYRRRHKLADLPAIKRWAWQILQGLVYLHGHNPPIIHRDLKCDNIFVSGSSGVVKIGDLGLVTLCKDFTAPQSVLGTPEFMAPELYEEKYDEKVDVYAFGMCLLELATMEYPYEECKNAAQIYKKVTQGIPPASVEKLTSTELREFIMLCLCHDPSNRPEARQLLKHSFFEAIRATAASSGHAQCALGGSHKLLSVSSLNQSRRDSVEGTRRTSGAGASPNGLSPSASASENLSGGDGGAFAGGEIAAAAATGPADITGAGISCLARMGSIAAAAGGITAAAGTVQPMGSIAAAAAAATAGLPSTAPSLSGSVMSSRANSFDLARQASNGVIAASLTGQPSLPSSLPPFSGAPLCFDPVGTLGGQVSPLASPGPLSPVGRQPAGSPPMGSIAAAATPQSPPQLPHLLLPVQQALYAQGGCSVAGASIASSLSPSPSPSGAALGGLGATLGTSCSPGSAVASMASMSPGQQPWLQQHKPAYSCAGFTAATGRAAQSPTEAASAAGNVNGTFGGSGEAQVWVGATTPPSSSSLSQAVAAASGAASANGPGCGQGASGLETRPQAPAGISSSAAAIAAAAVSAAAAAVAAGSHPNGFMALGLPSIHEDHELNEGLLFDNDEPGGRGGGLYLDDDDQDGDDSASYDGTDYEDGAAERQGLAGGGGVGRSQPVSLKVRSSSGQSAPTNMALSFAMSFTNQRGVRKKVGFQYDLLHDTASAIAVEMVENLSLNTAEAEAIAAMIQHEVSRFNQKQHQQQQQQEQQP